MSFDPTRFESISNEDLILDLREAAADLAIAELALMMGIDEYSGGKTEERILGNREQMLTITRIVLYRNGTASEGQRIWRLVAKGK